MTSLRTRLAAGAAALLLGAGAAGADWLVTADGTRIETRGEWEVRGRLVLFHTPNGTLSSLRLSEVDLEASRDATETARQAVAQPAPERRRAPGLILTDADVSHVEELPAAAAGDGEGDAGGGEGKSGRLAVASWSEVQDPALEGVTLTGRVTNRSAEALVDAGLRARLLDADGAEVAVADAKLSSTNLPPGASATFRADFPLVYVYERVDFETRGFALASGPASPPTDEPPGDRPENP